MQPGVVGYRVRAARRNGTANRDIFVAALERQGLKPVETQSYRTSDKDFSTQRRRIRAADPEAIAIFGTIPAAPAIMNQAGTRAPITAR